MTWRRWVVCALVCVFVLAPGSGAVAGEWITKGGSPQRMSVVFDPQGLIELTPYWETPALGESASQPVMVEGVVYHLAGDHLWRLRLDNLNRPIGEPEMVRDPVRNEEIRFNRAPGGAFIAPQSSPSFSPETGILYFGTGYGWLWAYHIREGWAQPAELDLGCPIVGSPLVIHDQGRDIVVVSDRPNYPGEENRPAGRPLCPRSHGRVWVVQGLDRPDGSPRWKFYDAATTKQDAQGFGG
ncbi:MAG: hypothetical protein CW346_17250, partial [Bacillaceae bacterium]|nr:hypothetical protein [Bacillaceae bacterium]